ncbi:MAG: hypothetical protein GY895_19490 [Phycisphaera sp.]|nr:hypothetical protein [Phycisphaera sp.]
MSTVPVPQAIDAFLHAKEVAVQVEQIRPATLTKIRELSEMVREGLPRDVPVEQLKTSDFRELIVHASRRWGPVRLKHLRSFVRTWIQWCREIEGIIDVPPRLGDMPSKPVRITPKPLYTPAEFRHLWERLDSFGRSVMGLGLFAGCSGESLDLRPRRWPHPGLPTRLPRVQRGSHHLLRYLDGRPVPEAHGPQAFDGLHRGEYHLHLPTEPRVLAAGPEIDITVGFGLAKVNQEPDPC